jgi:hypothetical protein
MSNPTSTFPKQRSQISPRVKALIRAGQWPPEGHPWRALALLPPEEVAQFFRGPIWAALRAGLSQQREGAVDRALHERALDKRDEARGVANALEDVLILEQVIKNVHDDYKAVAAEDNR